jgi:hypothetical protein
MIIIQIIHAFYAFVWAPDEIHIIYKLEKAEGDKLHGAEESKLDFVVEAVQLIL